VCTVNVSDVDATLAKAIEAGGQLAVPKMAVPGVGRMAYGKDTVDIWHCKNQTHQAHREILDATKANPVFGRHRAAIDWNGNGGKTFAQTFIATQKPDVLFQVAGKTGNGVLDAACEAGILGVGVDVDQFLSYPNAAACTVTSATKALELAVSTNIQKIAAGTATGGDDHWDATRDGVGVAPYHDLADKVPADVQQKLDDAYAAMKAGTLQTCPENCGKAE